MITLVCSLVSLVVGAVGFKVVSIRFSGNPIVTTVNKFIRVHFSPKG